MEPLEEPAAEEYTPPRSFGYRFAKTLPYAIGMLSLLALPEGLELGTAGPNYPRLLTSALGLGGTALYFWRRRQQQLTEPALTFFWVWAILQLVIITLLTQPSSNGIFAGEEPLWDTSQLLKLTFRLGFNTAAGNQVAIALNFLPVLLFAWIRRLRVAENFDE